MGPHETIHKHRRSPILRLDDLDIVDAMVEPKYDQSSSQDEHIHVHDEKLEYGGTDDKHENAVKLAPDGHTVLEPQPSSDPHDPLNWSKFRKHLILIIVSAASFLPDYGSATGAVTLLPQSEYVALP